MGLPQKWGGGGESLKAFWRPLTPRECHTAAHPGRARTDTPWSEAPRRRSVCQAEVLAYAAGGVLRDSGGLGSDILKAEQCSF